ncbi:Hsp70 family protein [Psychrobacter sp. Ps2]|uniref:Hsp70 family protein n=1 Tax=Psychrobacter sp. Ps2 TaxID=2790956 RepID=UPI001EE09489|nr:Hsp70 family protein [Psychrobacter sp. Ps2]MCG3858051.1 Hsp70 family protein [Psychrobacter sp. Ps2]
MRQKVDFGIDLGTTNSAIAVMQDGDSVIIKSVGEEQNDTTPSCISFNKKKMMYVGNKAKNSIEQEAIRNFQQRKAAKPNGYQEFKRNMGTNYNYESTFMDRSYTAEALSAEVLKKLKGYVRDESVTSAVITVPAMFEQSQLDATQRAAELAGFSYCELLQEPIAASIAYGIKPASQSGYWLVFDFGGGTFDAALMHTEDGIMKVVDSAGNNHLGGKDLDTAIVDQLLIPEIQNQYDLEDTISGSATKDLLQEALKGYAAQAKIKLSSSDQWSEYIENLGDDDEGEEIDFDITITLDQYEKVVTPIFQQAIDITQDLIKRNNLESSDLSSLILVGGPTFQQTLRRMLVEQVTDKIDTSIDPMTAVARGATLFASTKDIPRELQKRDITKAQLILKYPETTVETAEHLGIKIDRDASESSLPETFNLEVLRTDGAWSSGSLAIDNDVEIIELQLNTGKTNHFELKLSSSDGTIIPCQPSTITIIQGLKIANATLPYSIGIEVYDTLVAKQGVWPLAGLEKNKTLPAKGKGTYKTMQDVRPGMKGDVITIPTYEINFGKEGSKAIFNKRFGEISISGEDLPGFLPSGSDVEVTLSIDSSRRAKFELYFPSLDETYEKQVASEIKTDISTIQLKREINEARTVAQELSHSGNKDADKRVEELDEAERLLDERSDDRDTKEKVKTSLTKTLIELDEYQEQGAWPKAEIDLEDAIEDLRDINNEKGNARTSSLLTEFETQARQIISKKDVQSAAKLTEEINSMAFSLRQQDTGFWVGILEYMDYGFDDIQWTDRDAAFRGVQHAKRLLQTNPSHEQLKDAVIIIIGLMRPESRAEMNNVDTSLLRK